MFDTAIRRLLWKELRTQWHIWAALIAGTLSIQLLYLVMGREFQQSTPDFNWRIALVLSACYAVASVAVLFAGEREEETDGWLRQLPLRTRQLVVGKGLFSILSVVAFAAVAFGIGAFIQSLASGAPPVVASGWHGYSTRFLQASALMLLWTLFYSLILERVMTVLIVSVATQLIVAGVVGNFFPGPYSAWVTGIAVCLIAADVWLAKQWLSGRSVAPSMIARLPDGWIRSEGDRITTDRRRLRLSGVSRAARRTPLAARTRSVLLWRELRSAVLFAIGWTILGVIMVDLLVRAWGGGTNVVWLLATPLACGLLTVTGDQHRQSFRFLTDRGLSPLTVWLTKHAVWLTLAVGLVLIFALYDTVFARGRSALATSRSGSFLYRPGLLWSLGDEFVPGGNGWRSGRMTEGHAAVLVTSLGLSLYGIGHLCALWMRRSVVAASVACVCGLTMLVWHLFVSRGGVPLGLATWPLVIAMFVASLATVRGWLHEWHSWRQKLAKVAWVAGSIAAVSLAAIIWRVEEIPRVALHFDWQQHAARIHKADPEWSNRWQQISADLTIENSRLVESFKQRRMVDLLGITIEEDSADNEPQNRETEGALPGGGAFGDLEVGESSRHGSIDILDEDLAPYDALTRLRALAEESRQGSRRIAPKVMAASNLHHPTLGQFLVEVAYQYRQRGDLDEAWGVLADGLQLTAYLNQQVVNSWQMKGCWESRRLILQEVHAWAADENQTVARLEQADEYVQSHRLTAMAAIEPMLKNRYVYLRRLVEGWRTGRTSNVFDGMSALPQSLPFERERAIRLMTLLTAVTAATPLDPTRFVEQSTSVRRADSDLQYVVSRPDLNRLSDTTPLLPHGFYPENYVLEFQPLQLTEDATPLVLQLHMFRVEHGRFPTTLQELHDDRQYPDDDGTVTRDTRLGEFYGYAPDGLPQPAVIQSNSRDPRFAAYIEFIVPAGLPLLWPRHTVNEQGERINTLVPSPDGTYFHLNTGLKPGTDPDPETFKSLPDTIPENRLLFVILGRSPW